MGITSNQILISSVLITAGLVEFARARLEYEKSGKLNPLTSLLIFLTFASQFASGARFLHPRLTTIKLFGPELGIASVLIILGITGLVIACCQLGLKVTSGIKISSLRQTGRYRFSRNPQVLAGFFMRTGFLLLWSSWSAILWMAVYLILSVLIINVEEEHLGRVYGEEYYTYCLQTPRFFGALKIPLPQRRTTSR